MLYANEKLPTAYLFKESFYKVIASKDYNTAKERLTKWIIYVQNSSLHGFVIIARTMNTWISGILNSFTTPYTEGINNKIKILKCNAYGYRNFERFRNRILHMCHKKSS